MAGIAAGHEDGIDARQLAEHFAPFLEREFHGLGVGVIAVHGGIPDPHVEPVGIGEARHLDHHLHGRQRKVRAVGGIVGARRDQLDGVGAEDDEVANVLLPHGDGPAIVGVGLGAVAQLVAAQGVPGRGGEAQIVGRIHGVAVHVQVAEQGAGAEERAAGVVAHHQDVAVHGLHAVAFGACRGRDEAAGKPRGHVAARKDGRAGGPLGGDGQANAGASGNLIREQNGGLLFGAGESGGGDDRGVAKVEGLGGESAQQHCQELERSGHGSFRVYDP